MCGRIGYKFPWEKTSQFLYESFQVEANETILTLPLVNVAPTQPLLSVIHDGTKFRVGTMVWGLTQDHPSHTMIINARSETIHEKPTFRQLLLKRRCLILASGFYEWDRRQKPSQPYWCEDINAPFLVFAGIYQMKTLTNGQTVPQVCLITTGANDVMAPIHDRLPVILNPDQYKHWAHPKTPYDELTFLFKPTNKEGLHLFPVTQAVNKASYQGDDAMLPIKK